jgi:hypothetical protein
MLTSHVDSHAINLIMHLRDQHGMHIVACARCDGYGCHGCEFEGIVGVDFDAGKDEVCGPDCPANDLFRLRLN